MTAGVNLDKDDAMQTLCLTLVTQIMLHRGQYCTVPPTHRHARSRQFWWKLQAANLSDYLNDSNLVATVFVPTNDAFTKALSQYGVTPAQVLQQTSLVRGVSLASIPQ